MIKKIALLGSTGSIGTQTLQVIKDNKNLYKIQSLVAFSNAEIDGAVVAALSKYNIIYEKTPLLKLTYLKI